jgi:hypothetical protein
MTGNGANRGSSGEAVRAQSLFGELEQNGWPLFSGGGVALTTPKRDKEHGTKFQRDA